MDTKLPTASKFKSYVELYRWVRGSFHKILYELGDVLRNSNLTRLLIQLVVIEGTHRSRRPTEQPWCGTGSIRFFQATLSCAVCEACMDGTGIGCDTHQWGQNICGRHDRQKQHGTAFCLPFEKHYLQGSMYGKCH